MMHARNEGPGGCVPWEEFERLRERGERDFQELARTRELVMRLHDGRADRLRIETEVRQLEAEVERLRGALGYGSWEAQAVAYRVEVDRLREALEAIIDGGWNQDGMVAVAKTALGRTPALQQEDRHGS